VDAAGLRWGGGADWNAWVAGGGEKVKPKGREKEWIEPKQWMRVG
jgi:hypothetical protein